MWLLVINLDIQVASQIAERLKTYNLWKLGKSQNLIQFMPSAYSFSRNETFVSTYKSLLKNRNWTLHVLHCFT